jgi:hypothetical protein
MTSSAYCACGRTTYLVSNNQHAQKRTTIFPPAQAAVPSTPMLPFKRSRSYLSETSKLCQGDAVYRGRSNANVPALRSNKISCSVTHLSFKTLRTQRCVTNPPTTSKRRLYAFEYAYQPPWHEVNGEEVTVKANVVGRS